MYLRTLQAPDESNPKIVELKAEIEKVLEERRAAERDLAQLEADTTVKNSEIKNLEVRAGVLFLPLDVVFC